MTFSAGGTPRYRFTDWEAGLPGVVAGITAVGHAQGAGSDSDFGLATGGTACDVARRYEDLARSIGMRSSAVARQVHGTLVLEVDSTHGVGALVVGEADGLMTSARGVLLAVTAADCVPVFIADRGGRCVALLHAGWRGTAAGILRLAVEGLGRRFGTGPRDLSVYLGPSICGFCYEVGAEVLRAFGRDGSGPSNLDLRSDLADRAVEAGIPRDRVTHSSWCTGCGPVHLHSHRARGSTAGRMAAFLGLEPAAGAGPGTAATRRELR